MFLINFVDRCLHIQRMIFKSIISNLLHANQGCSQVQMTRAPVIHRSWVSETVTIIRFIQLAMWNESLVGTVVFLYKITITLELGFFFSGKTIFTFQIESVTKYISFDRYRKSTTSIFHDLSNWAVLRFYSTEVSSPEEEPCCVWKVNGCITLSGLKPKSRIQSVALSSPLFSLFTSISAEIEVSTLDYCYITVTS